MLIQRGKLTLWIVLDIPFTRLSTVETDLMKMILNSGLDVISSQPIRPRWKQGSLEVYTTSLCQCLKAYSNTLSMLHPNWAAFHQFGMNLRFKPEFGTML